MIKFWSITFLLGLSFVGLSQDLSLSGVSGPTSFSKYHAFEFRFLIHNNGIVSIDKHYAFYAYFSEDDIFDSNDYLVAYYSPSSSLSPGSSLEVLQKDMYPVQAPSGDYNLILIVDRFNSIIETDEGNNTLIIPGYTVTEENIDFFVSSFGLDRASYFSNDIINPTYQIKNGGTTVFNDALYTSFYLSEDEILDVGDQKLRYYYASFLGLTEYNSPSFHELILPTVAPGDYYIIANVDDNYSDNSEYEETDESNNAIASSKITISNSDVDLKPSQVFIYYNDPFLLTNFTLTNLGTTGVSGYLLGTYLSADQILDENDFEISAFIRTHTSDYVPGGTSMQKSLSDQIYNFGNIPDGNYYVIVNVNGDGGVQESDYTNNTVSSDITISISAPEQESISISASLSTQYNNTDTELDLDIFFFNNTSDDLDFPQDYKITIRDVVGVEMWSGFKFEYFFLTGFASIDKIWTIDLDSPLAPGSYTMTIECISSFNCYTTTHTSSFVVEQAEYHLSGDIVGEDGVPITSGKLFLYKKETTVKFIEKIDLTMVNEFSFGLDENSYTLYFIPDESAFPNYVPTILGGTVLLGDNNFIDLATDLEVTLSVIKISDLGAGDRSITGQIKNESGSGGRIETLIPIENIPVLLLNAEGKVVAKTKTNASGFYEFSNLPKGQYSIVLGFELDLSIQQKSYSVDVTIGDAIVDLVYSEGEFESIVQIITGIEFNPALRTKVFPNPFDSYILVENSYCHSQAVIVDPLGRQMVQINMQCGLNKISTGQLSKGPYILRLIGKDSVLSYHIIRN